MLDNRISFYRYPLLLIKGIIKKYALHKNHSIFDDITRLTSYQKRISLINPFYEKYINHTEKCLTADDIAKVTHGCYDAFIVGSDQIWRKEMTHSIGWENFMFAFLGEQKVKRVAYGVSFGKDVVSYSTSEKEIFANLYKTFDAVSVREDDGLSLLQKMGCKKPEPSQVLDPTLLLKGDDYVDLFASQSDTIDVKGKIFCYVLDDDEHIREIINHKSEELGLQVVRVGISGNDEVSIPQWLKCIYDASYVITDSYHGVVFSILFGKQFLFCGNEKRGNSRVESLFRAIEIDDVKKLDYSRVKTALEINREQSMRFLRKTLMTL